MFRQQPSRVISFNMGAAPFGEDLPELGEDTPKHFHATAVRFCQGLRRLYGPLIVPGGAAFSLHVESIDHDLAPHYEVTARVVDAHPAALKLSEYMANSVPGTWTDLEQGEPIDRLT